jgi:hypothetical protein
MNAPFTSPHERKIGAVIGPVVTTMPVRKPTTAPITSRWRGRSANPRVASQRRRGIMARKNTPSAASISRGGSASRVRAPSAAAGTPVIE